MLQDTSAKGKHVGLYVFVLLARPIIQSDTYCIIARPIIQSDTYCIICGNQGDSKTNCYTGI